MNSHEHNIAAAFNAAATTYNDNDDLQTAAGHQLIQEVSHIRHQFMDVVDAGCGTGFITTKLANTIAYSSFVALDIAEKLLQQAPYLPTNITRQHGSFNQLGANNEKYDLIFSNLALHWSDNFPDTLRTLQHALNENGLIAFSVPLHGTFTEIENHFSIHAFMKRCDIEDLLNDCGLYLFTSTEHTYAKKFNDTLSALRSIKLTGTNHVNNRRHVTLRGKSHLPDIQQLTYQVGFFIAGNQNE